MRFGLLFSILFCLRALATGLGAVPTLGGEVWIAASTNAAGTGYAAGLGTIASPLVGDLDFIKAKLPALCRVHISAGDFWTAGGWDVPLKAFQHWSGAGMFATRVHMARRFALQRDQSVFWSDANGITIEDMTLDANGADKDEWQRNGLDLFGQHISVRRVRVIGSVGNRVLQRECFPIFVGIGNAPGARSIITECEVSQCRGDYITAINLNGQGVVSFCRVELPQVDPSMYGSWAAYNSSRGENTLFLANVSEGGLCGYYTDTGSETNLSLIGNTFRNCQSGIVVNKYTTSIDGLNISDNTIELATNSTPAHAIGIGIVNFGPGAFSNVRISGNQVRFVRGAPLPGLWLTTTKIQGLIIAGNLTATNMTQQIAQ